MVDGVLLGFACFLAFVLVEVLLGLELVKQAARESNRTNRSPTAAVNVLEPSFAFRRSGLHSLLRLVFLQFTNDCIEVVVVLGACRVTEFAVRTLALECLARSRINVQAEPGNLRLFACLGPDDRNPVRRNRQQTAVHQANLNPLAVRPLEYVNQFFDTRAIVAVASRFNFVETCHLFFSV